MLQFQSFVPPTPTTSHLVYMNRCTHANKESSLRQTWTALEGILTSVI